MDRTTTDNYCENSIGYDNVGRERSNTWPSSQLKSAEHNFLVPPGEIYYYPANEYCSPGNVAGSHRSSALSLITESNESLVVSSNSSSSTNLVYPSNEYILNEGESGWIGNGQTSQPATTTVLSNADYAAAMRRRQSMPAVKAGCPSVQPAIELVSPPVAATVPTAPPVYRSGHPSYVELITQAILTSADKRMTLAEIYDWMVSNVEAFQNQRNLHSSTGWKNSVRHNLSLHSRFKRVKRNGMDKPSWWTVDLNEEAKRYRNGGASRQSRAAGGGKAASAATQQSRARSCRANTITTTTTHPLNQRAARNAIIAKSQNIVSSTDSLLSTTGSCYSIERLTPPLTATALANNDPYQSQYYYAAASGDSSSLRDLLSGGTSTMNAFNIPNITSQEAPNDGCGSGGDLPMHLAQAMAMNMGCTGDLASTTTSSSPLQSPSISVMPRRMTAPASSYDFNANCGRFQSLCGRASPHIVNNEQTVQVKTLAGDIERMSLPNPAELKIEDSNRRDKAQKQQSQAVAVAADPSAQQFVCGASMCAICGPVAATSSQQSYGGCGGAGGQLWGLPATSTTTSGGLWASWMMGSNGYSAGDDALMTYMTAEFSDAKSST